MKNKYTSKKNWPNIYFKDRLGNNYLRLKQFQIDKKLINEFILKGKICDVGCSTGEFLDSIDWKKNAYGMETNKYAKKIASRFISFKKDIFNSKNFFDLIIFRGTIQHIDEPFNFIKKSYSALKKGGYIIFLSVPNGNSPLFRIKKTLPVLHKNEGLIYYIPRDNEMINCLKNFGFKLKKIEYPYINTPYENFVSDHLKFLINIFSNKFIPHAFWRSSFNIVCKK